MCRDHARMRLSSGVERTRKHRVLISTVRIKYGMASYPGNISISVAKYVHACLAI